MLSLDLIKARLVDKKGRADRQQGGVAVEQLIRSVPQNKVLPKIDIRAISLLIFCPLIEGDLHMFDPIFYWPVSVIVLALFTASVNDWIITYARVSLGVTASEDYGYNIEPGPRSRKNLTQGELDVRSVLQTIGKFVGTMSCVVVLTTLVAVGMSWLSFFSGMIGIAALSSGGWYLAMRRSGVSLRDIRLFDPRDRRANAPQRATVTQIKRE